MRYFINDLPTMTYEEKYGYFIVGRTESNGEILYLTKIGFDKSGPHFTTTKHSHLANLLSYPSAKFILDHFTDKPYFIEKTWPTTKK